jgi:hypothetical protein
MVGCLNTQGRSLRPLRISEVAMYLRREKGEEDGVRVSAHTFGDGPICAVLARSVWAGHQRAAQQVTVRQIVSEVGIRGISAVQVRGVVLSNSA